MYAIPDIITLAKQIQDKLIQHVAVTAAHGSDIYDEYYTSCGLVYSIRKALEFENTYPGMLKFDEIQNCIDKIIEFYYASVLDNPIYIGSAYTETVEIPIVSDDRSTYILAVSSNGQSVFTELPFNIEDVDTDTLDLYVNGEHIPYSTVLGDEAFHMVNNVLYWHGGYDLKIGDIVILKYA